MSIKNNISYLFQIVTLTFLFFFVTKTNAQEIRVIDNKGTITDVRNNNVITGALPALYTPVENDIWFDTTVSPAEIKIYDDTGAWVLLDGHRGTPGSVFFADATNGSPTEDNANLFWDDTNDRLGIGTDTPLAPFHISAPSTTDAIGTLRIEGNEPDIVFDDTDGGFNTFTFRNAGADKAAIGRHSNDSFYITINDGSGWNDNAFTIKNSNSYVGVNVAAANVNSRFHINGSVAKSIISTAANLILDDSHHTVIINNNLGITLPAANTCEGRIYILKNHFNASIPIDDFQNITNTVQSNIPANTSYTLQSDGSLWQLISDISVATDDQVANEVLLEDTAQNFNTTTFTVSVESAFINLLSRFTANNITVLDTQNYYTSGTVESVLSEIAETEPISQAVGNAAIDVTNSDANTIATYTNAAGMATTINETVTSLTQDDATTPTTTIANITGDITYTNELGAASTVQVISTDADNNIQVGSDGGAFLSAPITYAAGRIAPTGSADTNYNYNSTITKNATGDYTISFTDIGTTSYIIQLTPEDCANCANDQPIVVYSNKTNTSFTVTAGDGDNGAADALLSDDVGFMYTVIKLP